MNISFTREQEEYITGLVRSGDYQNASEAVRDAIRLHQVYRDKVIQELSKEIEKGWEGSPGSRKVNDIIRDKKRQKR